MSASIRQWHGESVVLRCGQGCNGAGTRGTTYLRFFRRRDASSMDTQIFVVSSEAAIDDHPLRQFSQPF